MEGIMELRSYFDEWGLFSFILEHYIGEEDSKSFDLGFRYSYLWGDYYRY
jgi:hypothetical protein